jgi:hypothetical protein
MLYDRASCTVRILALTTRKLLSNMAMTSLESLAVERLAMTGSIKEIRPPLNTSFSGHFAFALPNPPPRNFLRRD